MKDNELGFCWLKFKVPEIGPFVHFVDEFFFILHSFYVCYVFPLLFLCFMNINFLVGPFPSSAFRN